MLRVTIDILPHGYENHKHTLEVVEIINQLTNNDRPDFGNYLVRHVTRDDDAAAIQLFIEDYPRENGALSLAKLALELVEDSCRKSDGLLEEQITHSMKP